MGPGSRFACRDDEKKNGLLRPSLLANDDGPRALIASCSSRVSSRLISRPTASPNSDRDDDGREQLIGLHQMPACRTKAPMPYSAPIISALTTSKSATEA